MKAGGPAGIRLGICGLGQMGRAYVKNIRDGDVPGLELSAVCDAEAGRLAPFDGVGRFTEPGQMMASGLIDAVLIATPHFFHAPIGIQALQAGLHVLVEKPVAVHKADGERLLAAHDQKGGQVFAAMFNQRLDPRYRKIRDMVRGGELGSLRRINWIVTDWFRTEAYYASGNWRATWAGEGGGILLNQCPHNLDLYQWMFGMPSQVRGFCRFGRYHDIEVEDDVTAYFEHADGASAVFVTTTGESPGTNRLEVTGELGKLVLEDGRLVHSRNAMAMSDFSRTAQDGFARPSVETAEVALPPGRGEQHVGILKNFVNAIRQGEELAAPAREGIHSVELGNAILLSSLENETVTIPFAAERYTELLEGLIAGSRRQKSLVSPAVSKEDFAQSSQTQAT